MRTAYTNPQQIDTYLMGELVILAFWAASEGFSEHAGDVWRGLLGLVDWANARHET
jgi:hypothetical protein